MTNNNEWPGQRLGLPLEGKNSIARMSRRVGAIAIDWGTSMLLAVAAYEITHRVGFAEAIGNYDANVTLGFFFVQQWLLVSTLGYSIGHRVCKIAVRRLDGRWVGFWRGFIRTGLICLVIPVAIWDADQRGLHDKAVGTVLVRL